MKTGGGDFSAEAYDQLREAYAKEQAETRSVEERGHDIMGLNLGLETAPVDSPWADKIDKWEYPSGKSQYLDEHQDPAEILQIMRDSAQARIDAKSEEVEEEEDEAEEFEPTDEELKEAEADLNEDNDEDEEDNEEGGEEEVEKDEEEDEEEGDEESEDEEESEPEEEEEPEAEPEVEVDPTDIAEQIAELRAEMEQMQFVSDEETDDES